MYVAMGYNAKKSSPTLNRDSIVHALNQCIARLSKRHICTEACFPTKIILEKTTQQLVKVSQTQQMQDESQQFQTIANSKIDIRAQTALAKPTCWRYLFDL